MSFDRNMNFKLTTESVIDGNQDEAVRLTQEALDNGVPAKEFLDRGLMPGMDVVGVRFRDGDVFMPEVLLSARAMKSGMELLKPELSKSDHASVGKIIIGTVAGDLHNIR